MRIDDYLTQKGFEVDFSCCSSDTIYYSKGCLFVEVCDEVSIVGCQADQKGTVNFFRVDMHIRTSELISCFDSLVNALENIMAFTEESITGDIKTVQPDDRELEEIRKRIQVQL